MKILIAILVLLISPSTLAEPKVYYCVEDQTIGFAPKENFKFYYYEEKKFKLKIDFDKPSISAPEIYMSYPECEYGGLDKTILFCTVEFGGYLSINRETYKFGRSLVSGVGAENNDSLILSHGYCEQF